MSWVKLNFLNYDIKNINSTGFYISYKDKCIKDLNHNLIINVPFLFERNDKLYKLEQEQKKFNLIIYLYINYEYLIKLVENNEIIPNRNELFEILRNNINNFKYNENIFNNQLKVLLNKNFDINNFIKNIKKNRTIIKTIHDNEIEYNNLTINLEDEYFILNKNNDLYLHNSYIIFDINNNIEILKTLINNLLKKKILVVLDKDINLNIDNSLYINQKNYKKIKLSNVIENNIIIIDSNLIKIKNYLINYNKFHSSFDIKKGYNNYKKYIDSIILSNTSNKNKIDFFNIELIEYDLVIFLNILEEKIINNINFKNIYNILNSKNKIFLQLECKFNFNYNYYKKIRKFIFSNQSNILDMTFNKILMKNNIFLNLKIDNTILKHDIEIIRIEKNTSDLIDENIKLYEDIFLYEKIFSKRNISYNFLVDDTDNNDKCPITYQLYSTIVRIRTKCQHEFSINGLINNLCFSSNCPLCNTNLINTEILLVGNLLNIYNLVFGKNIYNSLNCVNNNYNYILIDNILNCDILNSRVLKLNLVLNNDINIEYLTIENINNIFLKKIYKNIYINFIETLICDIFYKFKIFKCINSININNLVINVIKNK